MVKNGQPRVIPMPEKYIKEMVADWQEGRQKHMASRIHWPGTKANKDKMMLHLSTG